MYVHTVFPGNQDKILIDFNGNCSDFPKELTKLLDKCSLMIFHATEQEVEDKDELKKDFMAKYKDLLQKP